RCAGRCFGRGALARVWRDGWRNAAAGPRSGAAQPARVRNGPPGCGRRAALPPHGRPAGCARVTDPGRCPRRARRHGTRDHRRIVGLVRRRPGGDALTAGVGCRIRPAQGRTGRRPLSHRRARLTRRASDVHRGEATHPEEKYVMRVSGLLEAAVYGEDLAALEKFYVEVFGLEPIARTEARNVVLRAGRSAL